MRKKYICGNWKMNKTSSEALEFAKEINKFEFNKVDVLLAPSFVTLESLRKNLKDEIKVAGQNVSQFDEGAYTGEVSTSMVKDIGVDDVIIGHSERREKFLESDEIINAKVKKALEDDLSVILCLGESLEIKEEGREVDFVREELLNSLDGVEKIEKITIAYEPIWAIGTGKTCSSEDAEKMCREIRNIIDEKYGEVSQKIRILYGGSVKPSNAGEILSKENIDGVLVGGASLKASDFIEIIKAGESL
ncbi:MAG: triose-phosphate isomerase [Peptoniphilus harei]|uniref:triose-phosphate isomerase n=1 Tax=Peptoniphilus harei TaxID=54005 RepID=UPI00254E18C7|nr:triose-phosphate isomerase [Peptoniphilus harei]MDK7755585.1 triose-phosphate isomerase [Peptoniphilus harei]MDK7761064.1 triose-phosphate isomerase [Peptoniphilus harei]MDK8270854.1 triose-phosphate isomerase [Peptoniphilus harei]MDK8339432.1 triose-phosphate isomerase [Peptoniphilus harei]